MEQDEIMFIKHIENGIDISKIAANIAAVYDTSLEPGESIPLHIHPDLEELYYVLSGYGFITIGEEKQEISRYDVVHIPQRAPHTLLNSGNVPMRFITISVKICKEQNMDVQPYIG